MSGRWGGQDPHMFSLFTSPIFMKSVGYSAVIYEIGKGMNADLFDFTPLGAGLGVLN